MTDRRIDVLVVADLVGAGHDPATLERCLSSVRTHLDDARLRVALRAPEPFAGIMGRFPEVDRVLTGAVPHAVAVNRLVARGDGDTLLLAPDAELTGPLPRTRAAALGDRVAAVAPGLVDHPHPWDTARRRPTVGRVLVRRADRSTALRRTPFSEFYPSAPAVVEGRLVGPAILVPRAAWEAVGPLDERYFPDAEEWEWQRRALAAGLRLLVVDEQVVRAGVPATPDARAVELDRMNTVLALGLQGNHGRGALVAAGELALERVRPSARRARRRAREEAERAAGGRHPIVITTPKLRPAGAERQRVTLANELVGRGHPVTIVALQDVGELVHELDPRVRLALRPWWQPMIDGPEGAGAVIISGTTNIEVAFAAAWSRPRSRRWLVAAHEFPTSGPAFSAPLAALLRRCDGIIALSELHRDALQEHQHVNDTYHCIPNGVPLREDRGFTATAPLRLGFLGRIVEFKNPHLLVEALARLTEFDWRLDLYGDGPDRERLEAGTPDAVRDRVHWHGRVPGPDHAFAHSDVLCMPTRHDAYPLVALEAMARGVPVIASAIGGLPEMLGGGDAGVLVPRPELDDWEQVLRRVLEEPESLKSVARAGWERVRSEYSVTVMADRYAEAMAAALRR